MIEQQTSKIEVGQVYRDTYFDGKSERQVHRTIRITQIDKDSVGAETLTDVLGNVLAKPRKTRVSFKTLRSGYALTS